MTHDVAYDVGRHTRAQVVRRGRRAQVILVLGYAGALRRSDLAGLELADLEPRSAGLLVTIRRSKTDEER